MSIVWIDDVTELDAANMNLLEQTARKGVPNGYAALGADGLVPPAQLPPIPPMVITDADIPASITRDSELTAGLATKADTTAVTAVDAVKVDRDSVVAGGARLLASKLLAGDANTAFYLGGAGDLAWGAGGAAALDNHLYRRGTDGWMRLDGSGLSLNGIDADQNVTADGDVAAHLGSASVVTLATVLGQAGIVFGAAPEITLARYAADTMNLSAHLVADSAGGVNTVAIGGGGVLFGGDTSLVRIGANALRTPGSLDAVGDLIARAGTPRQTFIGDIGGKPTLSLGNGFDAMLYRNGANLIRTDGTLDANALTINGVPVGGAAFPADTVIVAGTRIIANKLLAGDANPAWRVLGSGRQEWGGGGANVTDVSLYRASANHLATDAAFVAAEVFSNGQLSVADVSNLSGDVFALSGRVFFGAAADVSLYRPAAGVLQTDGHFSVGGNVNLVNAGTLFFTADTSLYRSAASVLKTDGEIQAATFVRGGAGTAGLVTIGNSGGQASIYFGNALDTNLYRGAANSLKTDGNFDIAGTLNLSWTGAVYGVTLIAGAPAANQTVMVLHGQGIGLRRVEFGAADSAGAGYRSLRVSN